MRNALRIIWMALVLLIVALISALVSMQLAIHGREVRVPDLHGKTPGEAHQLAEQLGLNVQIERQYYSPDVPEGRVLSQTPASGSTVRRGWDVRLALSLGPQRVTIPQLVGQSQLAATITINQRGLDLGSTASMELPGAVAGQVIGQDPPANASDASSPKISLLISQDPAPETFVMPSFIGQPLGTVSNTLKDAGFSVGKVTAEQLPPAPAPAAVPQIGPASGGSSPNSGAPSSSLAATSLPQAAQSAPAAQLAPASSGPPPSPASIIVSQEPVPGQKVVAGSPINFVVR